MPCGNEDEMSSMVLLWRHASADASTMLFAASGGRRTMPSLGCDRTVRVAVVDEP